MVFNKLEGGKQSKVFKKRTDVEELCIGCDIMKVERIKGGDKKVRDITKQHREYQADSCVWRAQLWGFSPNPLDLHGSQMCSKANNAAGSSPGSG